MKEQFVTYEIALKLKEKGFNENCMYPFVNMMIDTSYVNFIDWNEKYKKHNGLCAAPLWQQVIDWFREKHFIDIMIRQTQKDGTAYYKITKIETEDKIKGYSNFCKTVNIARQVAIEHALTLI